MRAARAEAAFWSAFLRNRNVDAGTSADGALPVAGGFALCLAGTFLEHAIGLGTTRPLRPDDLVLLSEFYRRRGLPAKLELDETVLARDRALLAADGYAEYGPRLAFLEAPTRPGAASPAEPAGRVAVRAVGDRRGWAGLVVRAFEDTVAEADRERLRRSIGAAAAAAQGLFVASLDGTDVGGGAVGISGEVAVLLAGAVLPAYRRRGVHRALLAARIAFGQASGASRAVLKAASDSGAERSGLALGFVRTTRHRRVQRLG